MDVTGFDMACANPILCEQGANNNVWSWEDEER